MADASVEQVLRDVLSGEVTIADATALLALRSEFEATFPTGTAVTANASPVSEPRGDGETGGSYIRGATSRIFGAAVDLARESRCGFPEVVYGPGKPAELIVRIFRELLDAGQCCLATRLSPEQSASVSAAFPAAILNDVARTARIDAPGAAAVLGRVAVVTAGSADRPVAEEAVETLRWMRCRVELIDDIGVAGPQRLLERVPELRKADALVVAAGMEGALPSVVAGHVSSPIFAVPTSVGYGASMEGISALLSMLNSCASNVAVVNIDAGFKAAYLAGLVARRIDSSQ